jgi:hypothetical protein
MGVVGITEVKEALGYAGITTYDSTLTNLIEYVQDEFEAEIGRHIEQGTYHEEIEVRTEVDRIFLDEFPIISVTALTVNGTLISASEYEIKEDVGVIRLRTPVLREYHDSGLDPTFPAGGTAWITYVAGYSAGAIPGRVKSAIITWIGSKFNETLTAGMKSERLGDRSYTRIDEPIPPSVQAVIDGMKRIMR